MLRIPAIVLLVLLGAACHPSRAVRNQLGPVGPSPSIPSASTTPASPTPPSTSSGAVFENTPGGRRSVTDVKIVDGIAFEQLEPVQTASGADGRYSLTLNKYSIWTWISALQNGYRQPCAATVRTSGDHALDIDLVSDEILSTTGVPPSMPVREPTLSGLVFERTPLGVQPISGAEVVIDFDSMIFGTSVPYVAPASTRSDAAGHYLLCGVNPVGRGFGIWVYKPGYSWEYVDVGATQSLDVQLSRCDSAGVRNCPP